MTRIRVQSKGPVMHQINVRNSPIGRLFGTNDTARRTDEIQAHAAVFQAIRAGGGVFRIVAFIWRHNCKDIQVGAAHPHAVIEQGLVVLLDMTKGQSGAQYRLLAAEPYTVQRPIAASIQDCMARIIRVGVEIVIAVLVVDCKKT